MDQKEGMQGRGLRPGVGSDNCSRGGDSEKEKWQVFGRGRKVNWRRKRGKGCSMILSSPTQLEWSGLHSWHMVSWEWRTKRATFNVRAKFGGVYFLLYNSLSSVTAFGKRSSHLCPHSLLSAFVEEGGGGCWRMVGGKTASWKPEKLSRQPDTRENTLQLTCMEQNAVKWN